MSVRKIIPNTITSLNLLCGVLGVIFAMEGHIEVAFLLMIAASVFDFCDGQMDGSPRIAVSMIVLVDCIMAIRSIRVS